MKNPNPTESLNFLTVNVCQTFTVRKFESDPSPSGEVTKSIVFKNKQILSCMSWPLMVAREGTASFGTSRGCWRLTSSTGRAYGGARVCPDGR